MPSSNTQTQVARQSRKQFSYTDRTGLPIGTQCTLGYVLSSVFRMIQSNQKTQLPRLVKTHALLVMGPTIRMSTHNTNVPNTDSTLGVTAVPLTWVQLASQLFSTVPMLLPVVPTPDARATAKTVFPAADTRGTGRDHMATHVITVAHVTIEAKSTTPHHDSNTHDHGHRCGPGRQHQPTLVLLLPTRLHHHTLLMLTNLMARKVNPTWVLALLQLQVQALLQ